MNGTVWLVVAVLVAVQLTLQIIALVQLVRTPVERVSIGGRKWVWALIIVFGEILGAIFWFVLGRRAAETDVGALPQAAPEAKQSAVDSLYGPPQE